jgi:hypothetical protein
MKKIIKATYEDKTVYYSKNSIPRTFNEDIFSAKIFVTTPVVNRFLEKIKKSKYSILVGEKEKVIVENEEIVDFEEEVQAIFKKKFDSIVVETIDIRPGTNFREAWEQVNNLKNIIDTSVKYFEFNGRKIPVGLLWQESCEYLEKGKVYK